MITLRKLTLADQRLLMRWRQEGARFFAGAPPADLDAQLRWHAAYEADPWDHMYIVERGGEPVGTIGVRLHGGKVEIQRVLLGARQHGRGGVMTEALAQVLAAYGRQGAFLRVLEGNTGALDFYLRNGFAVTGHTEDGTCLIMTAL